MIALAVVPLAYATCTLNQRTAGGAAHIDIRAVEEPIGCRTVTLSSSAPITVEGWVWGPDERKKKLAPDHLRALTGGGWEVGAPELEVGGRVELIATVTAPDLEVRLAPAPPDVVIGSREETRTLTLDPKHPGWGFADASRASTFVTSTWTFPPGTPAQVIPVPVGALALDAGGLSVVPHGVAVPANTPAATLTYQIPGAAPLGDEALPPGTLTLIGASYIAPLSTPVEGGIRFTAPNGGRARWRVTHAAGAAVIPDVDTFVAGLDWRFAQVSLPEPAVPVRLKGLADREDMYLQLLGEVRALRPGGLPGADPLRPRQLNEAWRSRWVTPVERALILHRFLTQERMPTTWWATGVDADPTTLVGFDTLLLSTRVGERTVWIDPNCTFCADGEVRTAWMGRPTVGVVMVPVTDRPAVPVFDGSPKGFAFLPALMTLPRSSGRLTRSLSLVEDHFEAQFSATGAAALWLREVIAQVAPPLRGPHIAAALGFREGTLLTSSGFDEAGAPISVRVSGPLAPQDPFPDNDATPWAGGWGDELKQTP